MTQEELAAAVGNILGKEVPVQQVSDEEYAEIMKGLSLPDYVLPIVVGIQQSIRNGSLEVSNTDFEKVLGRPVTPIDEALEQIIKANS